MVTTTLPWQWHLIVDGMMTQPTVLSAKDNRYKGKLIDANSLPHDTAHFSTDLAHSLSIWQSEGSKVIWLTLSEEQAALICPAINLGFIFHHISAINGRSVVLTKRLVSSAIIPEFANHTIGVGGIVLNQHNQVLTIVEQLDLLSRPGHFKFPGGAVDRGEHLVDAVIREVWEETGIKATFNGLVGFRHYHKGVFGTSNFYILCHLTALTTDITPCPEEIGTAQWMNIQDYLHCETVVPFNKMMLKTAIDGEHLHLTEIESFMDLSANEYEIFSAKQKII
ncbi:MAG: NUDIX domain-containing protein [Ostreibacterium sp.]